MHIPVLLEKVVEFLEPLEGKVILDATVGTGGYAEAILPKLGKGEYIGLDADASALQYAKERVSDDRLTLVLSNFSDLRKVLGDLGVSEVDGVIMDLGVSSLQLEDAGRGFSFQLEGPLDMRMDKREPLTAWELVNRLDEKKLGGLLREFGEERFWKRIAAAIVRARKISSIRTTTQWAEIVAKSIPRKAWPKQIHPATRTFQGLRIAVNHEVENLSKGLIQAADSLRAKGRLVVLAYHSLEDRAVKNFFKSRDGRGWNTVTKKPLIPDESEIARNRRARSAKLRVLEKAA